MTMKIIIKTIFHVLRLLLNTIIENHPDIALESVSRLVETASVEKVKEVINSYYRNQLKINLIKINFKSDITKKAAEISSEFGKHAQQAADTISKQTQELSQTAAYKIVKENVKVASQTIDNVTQLSQIKPYMKPEKLRRRSEIDENAAKVYESNTYNKF